MLGIPSQAGAKREANQAELDLESHPITTSKGHVKWVLARSSKMGEGSISVKEVIISDLEGE